MKVPLYFLLLSPEGPSAGNNHEDYNRPEMLGSDSEWLVLRNRACGLFPCPRIRCVMGLEGSHRDHLQPWAPWVLRLGVCLDYPHGHDLRGYWNWGRHWALQIQFIAWARRHGKHRSDSQAEARAPERGLRSVSVFAYSLCNEFGGIPLCPPSALVAVSPEAGCVFRLPPRP